MTPDQVLLDLLSMPGAQMQSWRSQSLEALAFSAPGTGRRENQDAYVISPGPPIRFGVFDGVGGRPHGAAAAQAAASKLPACALDVASGLGAAVRPTGGATTAAWAELHDERITIGWIGDSMAYRLGPEPARIGNPHGSTSSGLAQALGFRGRGESRTLAFDAPFILCTDGIPRSALALLTDDDDLVAWGHELVGRVRAGGGLDDATFVVVRRRP